MIGKNVRYDECELLAETVTKAGLTRIWRKTELAQTLFDNNSDASALNYFNRYLKRHPDLLAALHAAGWHPADRLFYPHQVKVVFDYVNAARRDR